MSVTSRLEYIFGSIPKRSSRNENTELFRGVLELNLDMICPRMAERIDERFATDSVHFIPEQRVHSPLVAVDDDSKLDLPILLATRVKLICTLENA